VLEGAPRSADAPADLHTQAPVPAITGAGERLPGHPQGPALASVRFGLVWPRPWLVAHPDGRPCGSRRGSTPQRHSRRLERLHHYSHSWRHASVAPSAESRETCAGETVSAMPSVPRRDPERAVTRRSAGRSANHSTAAAPCSCNLSPHRQPRRRHADQLVANVTLRLRLRRDNRTAPGGSRSWAPRAGYCGATDAGALSVERRRRGSPDWRPRAGRTGKLGPSGAGVVRGVLPGV
jgi:hypothetical protein